MIEGFKLAALEAGQCIMEIYEAGFQAHTKGDGTPVTVADQKAEDIILQHLSQLCPDIPVVAEEAMAGGSVPEIGERFILVDPLDGTREFINRNGEFTVNIALIENGAPTAGVIFAPAIELLYWGDHQNGAFSAKVTLAGSEAAQKIVCDAISEPIRVLASRSHLSPETESVISRLGSASITSAGSSLKFCRIAEGAADFYPRFGPTMEWDTAAGHAILCAAGGKVVTEDGAPLLYGKLDQPEKRPFENPYFLAVGDEKIISQCCAR
ncbi:3'(2'),5'-bisphosphate nucleotidase CysQ [Pseudovibrio axinellae]|uniref:3'(2'),5'-bisphosphate nucleotidase CysQ n=1 Tax=Pseudovibrio axinellae TaxID=989403 RepID=A0A165YPL9_9HYPH|nr:3'(2'),5'-bisphosphate nucleotidase CysQ [Pseudovibrio axinellae]KZL19102.1 3'(2'),5'-bisphosphate nucleotidase CysQ [Pseudovibrio axinellae]SER33381.1 sulfate adenylyltransferase subunit 2/3'(2'), 5'-bisphosphate nucleotidase [Pseudovibrio axinellae]